MEIGVIGLPGQHVLQLAMEEPKQDLAPVTTQLLQMAV
jgi:hypothetical protein